MKMKKMLATVLAVALAAVTFGACGGGQAASTTAAPAAQETTAAPAAPAATEAPAATQAPSTTAAPAPAQAAETTAAPAAAGPGLKIVIVSSPSGVDDGSFNENNYDGILNFIKNHSPNSTVVAIREEDQNNAVPAVEAVVADYDVVVAPGFQFAGISQAASDNPDKYFILIDSFPDAVDGNDVFDNIYAIQFAEQESGFFAGIAAASETKTNKVAVVNGIAYPSNVNYQYGFMSGVNYANEKFGTTAQIVELPSYAGTDVTGVNVGGNYIGDFSDEAKGKEVGKALLDEGVDILFVAAGGSGNGVFAAVKEHGSSMVIGCDVDQYNDGMNGSSNIVLTSALKVMDINVERALVEIEEGTFAGGNFVLYADTDSTGIVLEPGRQQLQAETITRLEDAFEAVKEGTIVPAANFNGYLPDDFPGLR